MKKIFLLIIILISANQLYGQYFFRNLFARYQREELSRYKFSNRLPLKCLPSNISKTQWYIAEKELMDNTIRLLRADNWVTLITIYSNCIKSDSSFCDAYFRLAQCLAEKSDWTRVMKILNLAEKKFPSNSFVYLIQGQAHLFIKYPQYALTNFQKMIELDPTNAEGYFGASVAFYELNKDHEAINLLHLGQKKSVNQFLHLKVYEAILLYNLNQTQRAYNLLISVERENEGAPKQSPFLNEFTSVKSTNTEYVNDLKGIISYYIGLCIAAKGEFYYEKARKRIESAKNEVDVIDTTVANAIGVTIKVKSLKEQLLHLYKIGKVINRNYSDTLADEAFQNRKIENAAILYSRQIKNDSADIYSYVRLAECYQLINQSESALKIYQLANRKFVKQKEKLRKLLERQYVRTDKYLQALALNEEEIKAHPNDKLVEIKRAFIFSLMGKTDEGLEVLKKIELKRDQKIAWNLATAKGELLFLQHQYSQALKYFEYAIGLESKDPYVNYYYGMCLAAVDQNSKAKRYLMNSIEQGAILDKKIIDEYQLVGKN